MNCRRFKPDVFGSLLVSMIVVVIALLCITSEHWIKGEGTVKNNQNTNIRIEANYGLFRGTKVITQGSTCRTRVAVVCSPSDHVCMFSCGESSSRRKEDLLDILNTNSSHLTQDGDIDYCGECETRRWRDTGDDICSLTQPADHMIRYGMWVSVIFFLIFGLLLSLLNSVLTTINSCHSPVSAVWGVDGLVVWNTLAGLMYLLVMVLWGAEYNSKIQHNLLISNTLRPCGIQWTSSTSLEYNYWLLLVCIILHLGNSSLLGWRQYRRYYSPTSQTDKNLRMRVADDKTTGTVMMF